jgi:hypothetical protein
MSKGKKVTERERLRGKLEAAKRRYHNEWDMEIRDFNRISLVANEIFDLERQIREIEGKQTD